MVGMQVPLQSRVPVPQVKLHVRVVALHVPTWPALTQSVFSQHSDIIGMQVPRQSRVPVPQLYLHSLVAASQVAVIPARMGQSVLVQQPAHLPSQHTAVPPAVGLHGAHEVPQELTLLSSAHTFEQLWVPAGQGPVQGRPSAMHSPRQSWLPMGHIPRHWVPSQVAVPPLIAGQATQELAQ
jgi:hypothetical protein